MCLQCSGGCANTEDQPQNSPEATAIAASAAPAQSSISKPSTSVPEETAAAAALPPPSKSAEDISATGIYQGQADNNFIEIKIDGEPEETNNMVFMLAGGVKTDFENMKLNTGDKVQLKYYKNQAGQLILTEIRIFEIK